MTGDRPALTYAEALARTVAADAGEGPELWVVSSATTTEFAAFLRAHAIGRGSDWTVRGQQYGPLLAQLDAPTDTGARMVVVVGVEDVFPELDYRGDTAWTPSSIEDLVGALDQRIAAFAATLVAATRSGVPGQDSRTVVVPPVVDPPALPIAAPAAQQLGRLCDSITTALVRAAADGSNCVRVMDAAAALTCLPRDAWRDDRLLTAAGSRQSPAAASLLARAVDQALCPPQPRKVIVTDLDDTLWAGTIGEDGATGVDSHPHGDAQHHRMWQRMLLLARAHGVLLAVCSRNEPSVLDVFDDPAERSRIGLLLDRGHLAAVSASWEPKSVQLRALADALGMATSTLVLVDDNPVELAEVTRALPDVWTLRFPPDGAGLHAFYRELAEAIRPADAGTDEDARRGELYGMRERAERARGASGSARDFLASLDMRLDIRHLDDSGSERARQLVNRANQFHLTGRRYDEAGWALLRSEPGTRIRTARLHDRFGDHGVCGVLVTDEDPDMVRIVELVLSCRVFNRTVESALLVAAYDPARSLTARLRATGRNDRVRAALLEHGFTADSADTAVLSLADVSLLRDRDRVIDVRPAQATEVGS
jgi:FkbH-like protein